MQPDKDNTFCWYPFSLLALKEWNRDKGIMNATPCCNSIRPETPDPIGIKQKLRDNPNSIMPYDIFHGEEMESIRQAMREGRRHDACTTCWRMEDRAREEGDTVSSYRMQSLPPGFLRDEETDQALINNPQLRSIDFAFGEHCNLRCRMCMPGLSNKLRADYKYFVDNNIDTAGIQQYDYRATWPGVSRDELSKKNLNMWPGATNEVYNWADNAQWRNILDNIHTLTHIKATGGETLLSKPFIEFMDTAIERGVAKQILLEFHTNATKFTDANIEKLKQFEGITLNLSIDSVGKNYEYIRYPMLWDKLDSSLRNLLEKTKNSKSLRDTRLLEENRSPLIKNFSFNVVLSALNAHYMPELLNYQYSLIKEYNQIEYSIFYVDLLWPENKFINVKFLSKEIKQDLIDMYQDLGKTEHAKKIVTQMDVAISFLKQNLDFPVTDQDRQNMLREITVFDKSRNQCYSEYLHPDIIKFLESPIE